MLSMAVFLDILQTENEKSLFTKLYEQNETLMYHVAFSVLGDAALAEDVVHKAFIRVIERFDKVGDPQSKRTKNWLMTITKNLALDELRSRRIIQKQMNDIEAMERVPAADEIGAVIDEYGLKELLSILPEKYRDILQFVVTYGLDYHTIAREFGITQQAARKRFERAKKLLKELLAERGNFTDEFYPE